MFAERRHDRLSLRETLVTFPLIGSACNIFQRYLARSREHVLGEHAKITAEILGDDLGFRGQVKQLLSSCDDDRLAIVLSSEFGTWQYQMRQELEARSTHDPAKMHELIGQFSVFLLALYFRGRPLEAHELQISPEPAGHLPIPGSTAYLQLPQSAPEIKVYADSLKLSITTVDRSSLSRTDEDIMTAVHHADSLHHTKAPRTLIADRPTRSVLGCIDRLRAEARVARGDISVVFDSDRLQVFRSDLQAAYATLDELWPELADAVGCHVLRIGALDGPSTFSYSEMGMPNTIFLNQANSTPLWYPELLAHETAHCWLSSLMQVMRLLPLDGLPYVTSPWRLDPRPVHGILFGTHAFAIVTKLLLKSLDAGVIEEQVVVPRVLQEESRVMTGLRLLKDYGGWTEAGRHFLAALERSVQDLNESAEALRRQLPAQRRRAVEAVWPTVMPPWI